MPKNDALFLCSRNPSFSLQPRLKSLAGFLKKDSVPIILGLNPQEQASLKASGFSFLTEGDFEHEPFMADVNQTANQLAARWCEENHLAEALHYRGINLGTLIQHPMTYFLLQPLRDIALLEGVLRSTPGLSVYQADETRVHEAPVKNVSLEFLLKDWASVKPRPVLPPKQGIFRGLIALFWRILSPVLLSLQPKSADRILISSDLKHALPVMSELKENKTSQFVFLRDQYGIRQASSFIQGNIPFFVPPSGVRDSAAVDLIKLRLEKPLSQSSSFVYKGLPFLPLIQEAMLQKFCPVLAESKKRIDYFFAFLKSAEIRGILMDEDVCPFNKTLALTANQLGVPSIVIQHGAPFWIVQIALAPVSCTKIAAWGTYSKKLLLDWGVPEERIEVTGVPRYDTFIQEKLPAGLKDEVMRELGLDPSKKIAVLATDPFHEPGRADFVGNYLQQEELRKLVQTVIEAARSFQDVQLVIKLHPRDRYEEAARQWVKEAGAENSVIVTRTYSTPNLVRTCDVLLTVCSTVAIEAMLCDKPVVTINMQGGRDLQPHAELGAALGARDLESLKGSIFKSLNDEKTRETLRAGRQRVISEYVSELDGKAAARTAALLESLVRPASKRHSEERCLAAS